MPKPKTSQNNKTGIVRTKIVKRGALQKKKDRLKKLDLDAAQQTISEVEKPEEVDEETKRKEREEDRRRWLQLQRIKYPVAPDGYIPNSIVRRNLQPHIPRPPDRQPEEKTKSSFRDRRLCRRNSLEMLDSLSFRLTDPVASHASSSASMNAVDRDRPSSKKKKRSDVVNDVVTQIRQTSIQLTSSVDLEDIVEVEREEGKSGRGGGLGGAKEKEKEEEKSRDGTEDGVKEESRGNGGEDPLHNCTSSSTSPSLSSSLISVAKQPLINGRQDQESTTIQPIQEFEDNESLNPRQRRAADEGEGGGIELDVARMKDAENDVDTTSAAAAAEDAREDGEARNEVGRRGEDGEDLESYPPSSWKIPIIVEPGDDQSETAEEDQTEREGKGKGGKGGGREKGGEGAKESTNEDATAAGHDGNFGAKHHVTGSSLDGSPRDDKGEVNIWRRSDEEEEEEEEEEEGEGFDSREKEELVKVLDISLPKVRELDDEDSAAEEATTKATKGDDDLVKVVEPVRDLLLNLSTENEPKVDEAEHGGGGGKRLDGAIGVNGEEWGDGGPVSPSYSSLRPPRIYDDDLDLTSFDSSMAATNASLPTFNESQNEAKGDEGRLYPTSRSTRNARDFSYHLGGGREEREWREEQEEREREGHQEERQRERDRQWSSCSNGRLSRRYNRLQAMDDVCNPSPPPLPWHLSWYERQQQQQQGQLPNPNDPSVGSAKGDSRRGVSGGEAETEGEGAFLPQLLLLTKDEGKKRRSHACDYSILVQRRMHEHISITRYLRTKKLAEILCDLRRPINANVIKFQYAVHD